jgi:signal peptidase I
VKRPWLVRTAWSLGALAVLVLLVRGFVGDVYHVDSGSMEPTLWGAEGGGEWVFVRYDRSPPQRQELVVVQRPGEDTPIVKRVLGLPGERVQVSCGDVLINGQRLRADEPRPAWVPVYDQARRPLEDAFPVAESQRSAWTVAGAAARLDARAVQRDANRGLLFLQDAFGDDYLGPDGALVHGTGQANDARFEAEVEFQDAGSQLRVGLSEQGDQFQALVRPLDGGRCDLALVRRNAKDGSVMLASARVDWPAGERRRLAFENRDNVLRLEVAGLAPLVAGYRENAPHPSDQRQEGLSYGWRVWFGGEQGRFEFRGVRVLRDLCYAERGAFGVGTPCELGPDEFFVLGDHSSQSRDSREWGPVHEAELVGRPVAVVWPPARWRRLRGPEGGS